MRRGLQFVLLLALLPPAAAEIIDRIVATVNGHAILESELEDSLRVQRLMAGTDAAVDRTAELERLIDRALIEQQMERSSMPAVTEAEVNARLAELRAQIAPSADDAVWAALLASHALSEADLRSYVALQLSVLRFIEMRFRPSVYISEKDVEQYYQQTFVPEMRRNAAEPPPLAQVSTRIREVIVQQRVDDLLAQWLRARRAQTVIRRAGQSHNAQTSTSPERATQ